MRALRVSSWGAEMSPFFAAGGISVLWKSFFSLVLMRFLSLTEDVLREHLCLFLKVKTLHLRLYSAADTALFPFHTRQHPVTVICIILSRHGPRHGPRPD